MNGLWSVLIITEQGTCDRGYRYAVRIKNGSVGHADPANSSFRIAGRVAGNGAISVSVARGTQSANGSGRLSHNGGAGRWKSVERRMLRHLAGRTPRQLEFPYRACLSLRRHCTRPAPPCG